MSGLGAAILGPLVMGVLFAPRRWALFAIVAGILFLTQGLSVDIAGFNVYAVRFLELAGFLRVLVRRELRWSHLNAIDRSFVHLFAYTTLVFVLRSSDDWTFQIGVAVDAFLAYGTFRGLINGRQDLFWVLGMVAVALVPYAGLAIVETVTSENPFARVGGVELVRAGDRWFREGRLRATASFGHPSLMGSVAAAFLALYVGMLLCKGRRLFAAVGLASCAVMVWASNSGGPAGSVIAAAVGWLLWPLRARMSQVRWSMMAGLIALALVMKAPIWFLLARFSNVFGGDGYHRSALIDAAIRNLHQWWLAGMRPVETAGWLPYTHTTTGGVDMTNHFLVFGTTAGLGSLILLIIVLTHAFRYVGKILATSRTMDSAGREIEYVGWALGVMLGVHIFSWLGISYWDQSNLVWFLHLALLSSIADETMSPVIPRARAQVVPSRPPPLPIAAREKAGLDRRVMPTRTAVNRVG